MDAAVACRGNALVRNLDSISLLCPVDEVLETARHVGADIIRLPKRHVGRVRLLEPDGEQLRRLRAAVSGSGMRRARATGRDGDGPQQEQAGDKPAADA